MRLYRATFPAHARAIGPRPTHAANADRIGHGGKLIGTTRTLCGLNTEPAELVLLSNDELHPGAAAVCVCTRCRQVADWLIRADNARWRGAGAKARQQLGKSP